MKLVKREQYESSLNLLQLILSMNLIQMNKTHKLKSVITSSFYTFSELFEWITLIKPKHEVNSYSC